MCTQSISKQSSSQQSRSKQSSSERFTVNDRDGELDGIVRLLAGPYGVPNLIAYNTVGGLDFQRPSRERAAEMAPQLHRRGVLTKLRHLRHLRHSAGRDVEGPCGQRWA